MPPASSTFASQILTWYDRHARVLPWRVGPSRRLAGERPDPYRVWLSEVMLQQTTVAVVKAYFERFVNRWPTVGDLAGAEEAEVLGEWAGLGYYSRARNLHACARAVVAEHDGGFPASAAALKTLPGIGDYTSAAIAAIAFNEPAAVVDGNVERVTTRIHAIDTPPVSAKRLIREKVAALTPADRPGDFAQAMMDLGATICTPKRPNCLICPVTDHCTAGRAGTAEAFPVKKPKAPRPARRGAGFVAFRASDGAVWLQRRAQPGMLQGMSEPPTTAWSARGDGDITVAAAPFAADWRSCGAVEHGFTHFTVTLEVFGAVLQPGAHSSASGESGRPGVTNVTKAAYAGDGWWSAPKALDREALPTLMRKVLDRARAGLDETAFPSTDERTKP